MSEKKKLDELPDFKQYFRFSHLFTFSSLNYLQSGLSFIASILLARHLGTEYYGQYAYGMIFGNTLLVLMQFGTDKTLVRDLIQLEIPESVLTAAAFIWSFIGVTGAFSVFIWSFFISDMPQTSAWVVVLCTLGGVAQGYSASAWLDFKGKMTLQAVFGIIGRVLFLLGIGCIIFFFDDAQAVIYAAFFLLISRIISTALEWRYVVKTAKIISLKTSAYIRKIFQSNKWIWWATIGNLLMTQANQVILKDQGGIAELAYYSVSFQIIMLVRILQQQIMRLTIPSIAQLTDAKVLKARIVTKSLRNYCLASFVASLGILVPLFIITPWIIKSFIGNKYLPSIPVINILYIWAAFYGVALINNQFLIGLRKERAFFFITIIFGCLSIVLALILISRYDAIGAAMSLAISHLASITCQFVIVYKTLNYKKNDR